MPDAKTFEQLSNIVGPIAAIVIIAFAAWFVLGMKGVWVWGAEKRRLEAELERERAIHRDELARQREAHARECERMRLDAQRWIEMAIANNRIAERSQVVGIKAMEVVEKAPSTGLASPSQDGGS